MVVHFRGPGPWELHFAEAAAASGQEGQAALGQLHEGDVGVGFSALKSVAQPGTGQLVRGRAVRRCLCALLSASSSQKSFRVFGSVLHFPCNCPAHAVQALSDQLHGGDGAHAELRTKVMDHVEQEREMYEPFVEVSHLSLGV